MPKYRVKYQAQFEIDVSARNFDELADKIADIVIPENTESGYRDDTFELLDTEIIHDEEYCYQE